MANNGHETGYSDAHRAFLQAFMARSTMTFDEARPIMAAISCVAVSPEDVTEEEFSSYISMANTAISPLDLEIRSTLRQLPIDPEATEVPAPERVYALVNTTSDPLTQLATTYSADEIAFVKRVLDAIFDTNNTRRSEAMVVSGMQAIQLAKTSSGDSSRRESNMATEQSQGGAAQSLGISQAETVLRQLVEDGWLEKSRKGFYSLSPRGLMELRGWLVASYNDENEDDCRFDKIKFCAACRDIITVGQRCVNRDCPGRLHDHCIRNFFRMQQAENCPVCKNSWPGDKFVGERAITTTDQYIQGRRRGNNSQRQSGGGSSSQIHGTNVEGEDDSD
ncbi:hypothetical protein EYZ11_001346 [Aspergillus tanneri]|uniref:Non-structural maintenance of chromosomes element 1 homolog n=1 Tax=Aspergillus tanneri TaxID=1220188 RepID=A0A4S3JUV9_9EURO|nr:hypothetical protein EYZ11_001346 [Aspergillus tanneri]